MGMITVRDLPLAKAWGSATAPRQRSDFMPYLLNSRGRFCMLQMTQFIFYLPDALQNGVEIIISVNNALYCL
jgi:hypothetical protein